MKLLIIGSDSFIAKRFIIHNSSCEIKGVARKKTSLTDEIVTLDFFSIDKDIFKGIDAVINFAAIVHQPNQKKIAVYDKINHRLPIILAQKAKNEGVKHFVQMSTIAVYGKNNIISKDTKYNPLTPYGVSKLSADLGLLELNDFNFKITIVRPSMVYGGGLAPGNMLQLIRLVNKRIPLPFGKIDNSRTFCHVDLLIEVLSRIIEQSKEGIYLVADNEGISTSKTISIIAGFLKQKTIQFHPPDFFLKMLKIFIPNIFYKLFGSLLVDSFETFDNLKIDPKRYSFSQGIEAMIEAYKK